LNISALAISFPKACKILFEIPFPENRLKVDCYVDETIQLNSPYIKRSVEPIVSINWLKAHEIEIWLFAPEGDVLD